MNTDYRLSLYGIQNSKLRILKLKFAIYQINLLTDKKIKHNAHKTKHIFLYELNFA